MESLERLHCTVLYFLDASVFNPQIGSAIKLISFSFYKDLVAGEMDFIIYHECKLRTSSFGCAMICSITITDVMGIAYSLDILGTLTHRTTDVHYYSPGLYSGSFARAWRTASRHLTGT